MIATLFLLAAATAAAPCRAAVGSAAPAAAPRPRNAPAGSQLAVKLRRAVIAESPSQVPLYMALPHERGRGLVFGLAWLDLGSKDDLTLLGALTRHLPDLEERLDKISEATDPASPEVQALAKDLVAAQELARDELAPELRRAAAGALQAYAEGRLDASDVMALAKELRKWDIHGPEFSLLSSGVRALARGLKADKEGTRMAELVRKAEDWAAAVLIVPLDAARPQGTPGLSEEERKVEALAQVVAYARTTRQAADSGVSVPVHIGPARPKAEGIPNLPQSAIYDIRLHVHSSASMTAGGPVNARKMASVIYSALKNLFPQVEMQLDGDDGEVFVMDATGEILLMPTPLEPTRPIQFSFRPQGIAIEDRLDFLRRILNPYGVSVYAAGLGETFYMHPQVLEAEQARLRALN